MPFNDKVVLVAGGTGALGREVAMAFLEAGARVAVTYQRAEEFAAFTAAAERTGTQAPEGASLDVTDLAATESYVAELAARHGRLDILVNAVGGYAGGKNVWEAGAADYDQMMALNFKSGFALTHAVVPGDDSAESRLDRQRRIEGRVRAFAGRGALRGVKGGGAGADRIAGRRSEGLQHQREFDRALDLRYRRQSQGDAQGRLLEMAEAGADRARGVVSLFGGLTRG
jgi:NAD(P)-dependent dehydrogenase (short-subunit alcohol dehydrogenase family)